MRALTIHQPHAWLLAAGIKVIETRRWTNPYRGLLVIHAGKTFDPHLEVTFNAIEGKIAGAFIGYCYLDEIFEFESYRHFVDLKMFHMNIPTEKYWNPDPKLYGWRIQGAVKFKNPIPARGWLKLWQPRPDEVEKIRDQMKETDRC